MPPGPAAPGVLWMPKPTRAAYRAPTRATTTSAAALAAPAVWHARGEDVFDTDTGRPLRGSPVRVEGGQATAAGTDEA